MEVNGWDGHHPAAPHTVTTTIQGLASQPKEEEEHQPFWENSEKVAFSHNFCLDVNVENDATREVI